MNSIVESESPILKNLYGSEIIIKAEEKKAPFNLRGGFERKILFLTKGEGFPLFIPEIETMFQRMLTNLKTNENEIGLIDIINFNGDFSLLKKEFQPTVLVSFGINAAELGLNIDSTPNLLITMGDFIFMESNSFSDLYQSDLKKVSVFPALKKLFSR